MKKLYLPLFFGLLVILFTSCTKEYVTPVNNNQTILVSIPSQAWKTSDGVNYAASINVPEITSYLNETGEVLVYLSYGNGVYEQIPEVKDNISYSFSHNPGYITIYAQDINGNGIIPPDDTDVKIVLVDSNY